MKAILIIGYFDFPYGSAAAERMKAYAKAFRKGGGSVRIVTRARIPGGQGWAELADGIQFNSVSKLPKENHFSKWRRLADHVISIFRLRSCIREFKAEFPDGCALVYERRGSALLAMLNLLERLNVRFAVESVEWYDFRYFKFGWLHPVWLDELFGRYYCGRNGRSVICISRFIQDKYEKMGARTLLVPGIVDPVDYEQKSGARNPGDVGCQCVYLGQFKQEDDFGMAVDGIRDLISQNYDCSINLIGRYQSSREATRLRKEIGVEGVGGRVLFSGFVSDEKKNEFLSKADLIVLLRKDCQAARAAFPTRIAELLLTGIPLVTTNVGDIGRYLSNDENALLVSDGDIQEFKKIIRNYIDSEDKAFYKKIGERGRETALEHFTPRRYVSKIFELMGDESSQ